MVTMVSQYKIHKNELVQIDGVQGYLRVLSILYQLIINELKQSVLIH